MSPGQDLGTKEVVFKGWKEQILQVLLLLFIPSVTPFLCVCRAESTCELMGGTLTALPACGVTQDTAPLVLGGG